MSAFRMNDFVIYTVITCMYDCMDFGTPILFKYSLLKEIICTLDNISLIYFFTIIFFFIFSVVSICVFCSTPLKKNLILTLIIYYFGVIYTSRFQAF